MAIIEIDAIPDVERQRKVRQLLPPRNDIIDLENPILGTAKMVELMGFSKADAAHIAAAEAHNADVLLTTDDRFLRAAQRSRRRLAVKVANPAKWLEEQRDVQDT